MSRPFRAILNFTHSCAMKCEWCYIPFGSTPARSAILNSIIDRIADLGFTTITIGGGDPFQYRFIPDLLHRAKSLQLFVHVDTNGKSLKESQEVFHLMDSTIDLLGLPLDGSIAAVHDAMRGLPGHYDFVCKKLHWLSFIKSKIKINTVIRFVPDAI